MGREKGEMNKKIGVYICHCGTNITATVDCNELARFSSTLPGVKVVRDYRYLCSDPGQDLIKKDIRELSIDRVVVAACSPRMHEMTFRNAISSEGLNPYLHNIANIREQCSWVHKDGECNDLCLIQCERKKHDSNYLFLYFFTH